MPQTVECEVYAAFVQGLVFSPVDICHMASASISALPGHQTAGWRIYMSYFIERVAVPK